MEPHPLENGSYWLSVTFAEARRFGPMRLVRGSRTAVPFAVAGPR